jgi:hypothetical protein
VAPGARFGLPGGGAGPTSALIASLSRFPTAVKFPFLPPVPKWLKFLAGLLLLPACIGAARAFWRVLHVSGHAETFWVAFVAGAAVWLVTFLMLPKPMWIYVVGHELTHALWTWLFGGRVKQFKVGSQGGHVVVTRNNFLISLAPYFFPVYAALVVGVFVTGHLVWNWTAYQVWFHLLLGAAYSFHVTLTAHILRTRQSDIVQNGYLFSGVIIFLGNIVILLVGLPVLTRSVGVGAVFGWWFQETGGVWQRLSALI